MLNTIQAIRGIAALAVVFHHLVFTLHSYGARGSFFEFVRDTMRPGDAGVDLFFIVSGFIMVYIRGNYLRDGQRQAGRFLARRAERVIPPYWIYTTAALGLVILASVMGQAPEGAVSLASILHSYFLVPYEKGFLLVVGWTLSYEMLFYFAFTFGLLFFTNRLAHIVAVGLVFVIGVVIGQLVDLREVSTILTFFTLPIILEFVIGMVIAHFYLDGRYFGKTAGLVLIAAGIGLFIFFNYPVEALNGRLMEELRTPFERFIWYGIPSALIVMGALGLEKDWGKAVPRPLITLGNSSYSLYLSHFLGLHAMGIIWKGLGLNQTVPDAVFALILVVVCVVYAVLSYRLVEHHIINWILGRQAFPRTRKV